ncbi:MAG TPA: mechanosensitive ion channel domain-containing protein, partial [Gammaproteobacteria bacterium]|nr:mechanosensitive ion channel domain-containing protein [Gammaproteobacteria bacterium]
YLVVIVGCLICLRLLGIDLHALFLVASGLLIAISFGLRDLVNNFACGLLMLFERPLRVGDIVSINNQEGQVLHIGSRAVTIRTWDHMEVIVPNTEIFNKSFVNWTVKDDVVRTVITIKIDRQDNPHHVQSVIYEVLHQHKDVLKDPVPEVLMKEMIDTMCEFEVRYFINIRNVVSRVSVRSDVLFTIWNAFAQHGIKAPNVRQEILVKPLTIPILSDGV